MDSQISYKFKYLKYKNKYLNLKQKYYGIGGNNNKPSAKSQLFTQLGKKALKAAVTAGSITPQGRALKMALNAANVGLNIAKKNPKLQKTMKHAQEHFSKTAHQTAVNIANGKGIKKSIMDVGSQVVQENVINNLKKNPILQKTMKQVTENIVNGKSIKESITEAGSQVIQNSTENVTKIASNIADTPSNIADTPNKTVLQKAKKIAQQIVKTAKK